jgi:hypothetical protein
LIWRRTKRRDGQSPSRDIKLKESQVEELEQTRSTLHECSTMLAHSLRSCKMQLGEAEDKIRASNERAEHLATEFNVGRATFDRRIEELKAMLDEERLERQVGAGGHPPAQRRASGRAVEAAFRAATQQAGRRGCWTATCACPG